MEIEIREKKTKAIGVRLTQKEYEKVEELAKKYNVSISEATSALIRLAIKEI